MASKVRKWVTIVSFTASRIFFFFIFFQIPLFRFPCRIGTCMTPMELTSTQLLASEVIPSWVVTAVLYPGAIAKALFNDKPIPKYNAVLDTYKLKNLKQVPSVTYLQHIEVLAGSYLAIAGAMIGLYRSRRLGFIGMLLLIWGLSKEPHFNKRHESFKNHKNAIDVYYPTMSITVLSAFLSIRNDVKNIVSCFKWTFSKSKYK
ncbi:hypothetical protein L2E82_02456 [Cichorium intybus]|uniref:Uncharacterized protein n=1 Tax=Cichorium intybus TaxID=13427 RepID=A0ACB9H2T2_CICIN|nr:hypothetical protein L2E82_02456 [Cichorium intybus]